MVTSPVGKEASSSETKSIISSLERVGKTLQPQDLEDTFKGLPREVVSDKECISRFLLLVAFLDQQAESPTARKTAVEIYNVFKDELFFKPRNVIVKMDKLVPLKEGYKVSPAIGRVLPRFGWMVLRVGGFLIYEMTLNKKRLSEEMGKCKTPKEAIDWLCGNPVVESIMRDKAARMYVSWIGHPDLGINVSNGAWERASFEMPVDGHVGKVFSRTGMVPLVIHEGGRTERADIIVASKMRPSIQTVATKYSNDCIMVDHGAFRIGFNCCTDKAEDASCRSCERIASCRIKDMIGCEGRCILSDCCKRNMRWRAY